MLNKYKNKLFFLFVFICFSSISLAKEDPETRIVQIYKQFEKKHKKFIKNTMLNRHDMETFHEDVYVPAIKEMIIEIRRGKCKKCILPYIKTMAINEGSADEELAYAIKDLIQSNSKELSEGCKKTNTKILIKLEGFFDAAFAYMAYEKMKPNDMAQLKDEIKPCYKF